ncbi:MAG: hypothetical protein LBT40_12095 [Deltaproteobacteria bacterium]|nr:hypothetical protein [Deltaproteobacteria bacterium]
MTGIFTTFFTIKGGQGKTTLAALYALRSGGRFYTGKRDNFTGTLFGGLFQEGEFVTFDEAATSVLIEGDGPHVLDLDRGNDGRVRAFIRQSSVIVVPVVANRTADLTTFQGTLKLLDGIGGGFRQVFVANNMDSRSGPGFREALEESVEGRGPVFLVNRSDYFERFAETGQPVWEMKAFGAGIRPLRKLQGQLDDLFAAVDEARKEGGE